MIFKEETRINSSTDDEQVLEETLNTEGTISMEEANMRRAKVKMEEVREENERLKLTLSQMMRDYDSLKTQFTTLEDHQSKKPTLNLGSMAESGDESELVSLSLGRFSADSRREEVEKKMKMMKNKNQLENDGLTELGLSWKLNSDNSSAELEVSRNNLKENSSDESKEEEDVRSSRKINSRIGDDEILQNNHPLKKPRVSVRAVCNTQTMHDGCQWRKYGQKIAKGNPCPRAYYRCTVSSSCPVRKQVQRCIDDMSILVTTYEGSHNHPLPASATSMASATSAAVAMLSCTTASPPPPTTPSVFGLNNYGTNSSSSNSTNIINFPRATISSSQSHPTVILDLTTQNHSNKFSSSTLFSTTPTSLNFSTFDPSKFPAINNVLTPPNYSMINSAANDQKIAAATKAITHDPTFQSALAAAITSFVGNNNNNNGHGRSSSGMNFHLNFSQPSTSTTSNASIGCAASFMNRFPQPVINSQQKNFTHFAPLTLSASKSQTMSLADEGENR